MFKNSRSNVLTRLQDWLYAKISANTSFFSRFGALKPLVVHEHTRQYIRPQIEFNQLQEISQNGLNKSDELLIINSIFEKTGRMNRNNIKRTQAYYDIYRAHPELHWALLAHMVSRNSGWNMTDLKGEMLPHLLNPVQCEDVFQMLERANSLIFQDAYPQLLLYQESKQHGKNLFHLLEQFHVSRFMRPFWDYFWNNGASIPLTIALIVNEQNYIEGRVVQNKQFTQHVFHSMFFKSQALLQLNQVLFPQIRPPQNPGAGMQPPSTETSNPKLIGIILEDFTNLDERIEFGKKLYNLLFGSNRILKQIEAFAEMVSHTGSRADYWPQHFSKEKQSLKKNYHERISAGRFLPGAVRLFSPRLEQVWKDRPVAPIERYDWSTGSEGLGYIQTIRPPFTYDMTKEHCRGLNRIELAILAGQRL